MLRRRLVPPARHHRDGELCVSQLPGARCLACFCSTIGVLARVRAETGGSGSTSRRRRPRRGAVLAQLARRVRSACAGFSTRRSSRFFGARSIPLLGAPERALEPFRIANPYGLFATMTRRAIRDRVSRQPRRRGHVDRLPVPLQAAESHRAARHLRALSAALRLESLVRLARAVASVAMGGRRAGAAARGKPGRARAVSRAIRSPEHRRTRVRTVLWQYWFTDWPTKRATGAWWRRQELGLFSGVLTRGADGRFELSQSPP